MGTSISIILSRRRMAHHVHFAQGTDTLFEVRSSSK